MCRFLRVSFMHLNLRIGVGNGLIADIIFVDIDDEDAFRTLNVFVT